MENRREGTDKEAQKEGLTHMELEPLKKQKNGSEAVFK